MALINTFQSILRSKTLSQELSIRFYLGCEVPRQGIDLATVLYIVKGESSFNPKAIGDNGKSIGIFQIQKICWLDATNFNKTTGGKYENCFGIEYSKKIVKAYLNRYCSRAIENNDFETMARIWNGGPFGHRKESTKKYWDKIKKELDKYNKI